MQKNRSIDIQDHCRSQKAARGQVTRIKARGVSTDLKTGANKFAVLVCERIFSVNSESSDDSGVEVCKEELVVRK